ncbi:hypothetical protein ATCC90586_005811 [Pythium insidiosum]|nr:hypothetical protein ATCC90586_005811 [Pythium insidiosum]
MTMRAVVYLAVVALIAMSRPDGAVAQVDPNDPNLPITPSLSPSATPSPSPSSFSPSPSPSASASATPSPSPTPRKPRTPPPGADGSDETNNNGVNNNGANTPPPSPTTKQPKPTAAQPRNEAATRPAAPTSVPPEIALDRSVRSEYGTKVPSSKEQAAQSGAAQDDSISKLGSWLVPTVIGAVIVSALIVVTFFVQKRKQDGHGSPRQSDMFFEHPLSSHSVDILRWKQDQYAQDSLEKRKKDETGSIPVCPRKPKPHQFALTMQHRADLERIARDLTLRRTQVRQRIAVAKRALGLVLNKLDEIEDRLQEKASVYTDDELDDEWNAVQRLLDLRDEVIVRRQLLLSALIALGRHLIVIRQRERAMRSYISLTIHYVDNAFRMHNYVLEVEEFPGKHDAIAIGNALTAAADHSAYCIENALLYHDSYLQNLERTQNVHESVSREMQHEVATFVAKYRQKYGTAGASSSTTTMRSCLRANEELLVGRGDPWSHASPSEGRSALDPAIDYSPSEKATLLVQVTQCIYWMFSQASTRQRRKR